MRRVPARQGAVWGAVIPLLGAFTSASAATPEPPDTLVVPLREVVVTATRASQTLHGTPAAVSIVDAARFADTRLIGLQDALAFVPGVLVQSRAGAPDARITIRGFGARGNGERSNTGVVRGIRILADGIPLTEPDGRTSLDLVDLGHADRVEVVRSNASALYGNASGGVVNLRGLLDFERPYLEARLQGGAFGYHREQLVSGFTLGHTRGSLSLSSLTFDGWRRHSSASGTQAQLRMTSTLDERTRLGLLVAGAANLSRYPGALTQAQFDADPRQANTSYLQRDERRRNRIGRVALTFDRSPADGRHLSVSLFVEPKALQRSERNRFRDFTRYHLGGSAVGHWRMPVGPGWALRLGGGADEAYQDGTILFYNLAPGGGRGDQVLADKREGANSAGAFVEAELRWRERWAARLSARYDALGYVSEDFLAPSLDATRTFARWTPKGSVSYQAGDQSVYAALGGGVEAPAFNEVDPPPPFDTLTSLNPFLEASRSTTYELGARGRLLPLRAAGQLRYDAALYWIEVWNEPVPFDGGAYFLTAGRSRRRGAELALQWLPGARLELEGALTLSRNRYVDYRNELGDFGGHDVAGLPAKAFRGAARFAPLPGLVAGAAIEARDRCFADDANSLRSRPYTTVDATLAYARSLGAISARAYLAGYNLTDERYAASVFINPVNGEFLEPGLPRQWSGGLTLRWR